MQYPVPKNIDLEDKIIGPMTLRQFLYVLVGGTIAYSIIKKTSVPGGNSGLGFLIAIPIALFSLALAFIKIQERPFGDFLISLIIYTIRPKQRIWHKAQMQQGLVVENKKEVKEEKVLKKSIDTQQLTDLSKVLDSAGEENKK